MAETFHPISALLLFNMFQSLLALEGSLQSGEQIFKQEKMPRVADKAVCLSVYHPPLCGGRTAPESGTRATLPVHTFYWNFAKQEISGEEDNSRDSEMKLACHAERGPQ